ncbi:MAG: 5,10-methylenetetrahydrofolate reductase [uncultured Gemmatimonadetes bacterium]|uniref:5,10-methylenetetrahydrofolate reductase n=1 Tax=uncultured Gemmatimonadota bacterium TaxID=203437 RepID=A0A6J4K9H7_9BACT|nr:MAG: 5,10-methylenetetrahydrofolate reductase [uncultured Gemmatimonadota bacterium]
MRDFRRLLADGRPHLFDGAMGTMLYAKGVYINRCYDELSLTQPDLVRDIHRAYVKAGAEILETNTYGANRPKLARHGLDDRVREMNVAAAQLARAAAGERVYVAGAIGPLGLRIEPYGPTAREEARGFFREQAEALVEGGVDLFVLETFADLEEIHQAILGVREASELPIVAQMVIREDGTTAFGSDVALLAERLGEWGAEVVGLNCSVGPSAMLSAADRLMASTSRPVVMQPNAGLPRQVDGRTMYMASPEYMASYAARMIRKGVRLIGGCCGTTPEHVAAMAGAVRMLSPAAEPRVVVSEPDAEGAVPREPVPLPERSAWGRKLAAGEFLTTVEIVPPRGSNPEAMLDGVRLLKQAGVDGVNVPDGPRAQSRMGALATAILIQQRVGIEAVVHYCCRDRNLLGMLSDLLGAQALGLRNLLLITGDPPKMGPFPDATAVFDIDAIGLTNLVSRLNRGLDPGGNALGEPTSFVVGVGVNPGAEDFEHEMRRFYWKVEAGAEYAITQPVFDLRQLETFVERIEKDGLKIPLIAGIWPLVSARNAEFLANEVPGVVVSDEVMARMRRASAESKERGVEEGTQIAQEMLAAALPMIQGVQVSAPFGKVPLALRVFDAIPGWAAHEAAVAGAA